MNKVPKIAFCTTCRDRAFHIKQTLPQNLADNSDYPNAVFVLLDYSSPDDLLCYIRDRHAVDIETGRLVVYRHNNGGAKFHLSHAKNMAARCGILEGAETIITVDADNFCGRGFAQFIADNFCEPSVARSIFMCPDHLSIQSLPHGPGRPQRGFAGRLALSSQTFLKVGGYDEDAYPTWRGEDIDINFRLARAGYTRRFIGNGFLNTIPHGADIRFKEYPEAKKYENIEEVKAIRARTETVVNYGKFGVGKVRRNFTYEQITLGHIPTRIFCIGMHRTGTTSIHEALKILGFDSFHWGTGEAPLIWDEMNALGRSPTLERWYALSDLPIPLLYKNLDKAYPGSKFILTVRDEISWAKSVERLWDAKYNPTRWMWSVYPFSHRIHTELYGQKDFDAEVFLARYRRHNAEVQEYFKDRPQDLLVMHQPSWGPLCAFLDRPVPAVHYPRANQTRDADHIIFGPS